MTHSVQPPSSPKPPARLSLAWLFPLLAAAALAGLAVWRHLDRPSPPRETIPPPAQENLPAPDAPAPQPIAQPEPPSAPAQTKTPAPPSAPQKPAFRLSALFDPPGGTPAVGIVHRASGDSYKISVGDKSFDGWQLVSVDFDDESALFQKDGASATVRMEQGSPTPPASVPPSSPPLAGPSSPPPSMRPQPPSSLPPSAQNPASPSTPGVSASSSPRPFDPSRPFSNLSFRVDSGETVSVRGVDRSPEVVEVTAGPDHYALRRSIAESILSIENLTPEDRLWMMVSYPGLVEVRPGEDPAELSAEAERQLADLLIPPTNRPPVEELPALVEKFFQSPPPPGN